MRYLRKNHHISIKSRQSQDLRNLGYYHGYKGYRFIRTSSQRINFKTFDEIIAINRFDMQLKALLYPKIMFIETALKSYVIEALLNDSQSENLNTIFKQSISHYRTFSYGSNNYKKSFSQRMGLRSTINSTLRRNYESNDKVANHFFDKDREIPIWAIFESMTLGVFGTLFGCCNKNVKKYTSQLLHFPANLDSDGEITKIIILTLKNLRNSIAHNNIIFDCRFQNTPVPKRLIQLLQAETGLNNIDFTYIDAYFVLIVYILRKMGVTKTECKKLITGYTLAKEDLRKQIPTSTWNQILGTSTRNNMEYLKIFITNS